MHTVQSYLRPLRQMHHHVHRRDLLIHQVLYLRIAEFQPRIDMHAVQVIQRAFQAVRIVLFQRRQLLLPPGIGFYRHQHVRPFGRHQRQQFLRLAIGR
ncbi:hypothetical protein D3C80_1544140 [compost metagenome]